MKVFRVLIHSSILSACCVSVAVFSGCATTPKSAARPVVPLSPAAPAPAEAKAIQPPPVAAVVPPPVAVTPVPSPVPAKAPVVAPPAAVVVRHATIRGSQESSIMLDNFTAFVSSVDGRKVAAGRDGWNVALEIEAGRRTLAVEFNRGVFVARAQLELEATPDARYELKYATDAQLFGNNSYCNFWIVDAATGQTVTSIKKTSVEKIAVAPSQPLLP